MSPNTHKKPPPSPPHGIKTLASLRPWKSGAEFCFESTKAEHWKPHFQIETRCQLLWWNVIYYCGPKKRHWWDKCLHARFFPATFSYPSRGAQENRGYFEDEDHCCQKHSIHLAASFKVLVNRIFEVFGTPSDIRQLHKFSEPWKTAQVHSLQY